MTAIELLLSGQYGSEPTDCPVGSLIPETRRAYIVPHEYRALLALIVGARKELNSYKLRAPYYAHSDKVEVVARVLDEKLKANCGAPGIVIEYHADWLYSVLTHEDIVREHDEFEERERNKHK